MSGQTVKPFRVGSQRFRVLSAFFSGQRLTRFDAERIGCHTLPTLISDFETLGLVFDRRFIEVPTRWGDDARPMLYWLAPKSQALAAQYLGLAKPSDPTDAAKAAARAYAEASGG